MEVEKGTAKGTGICGIILLICGVASLISGFIWVGMLGFGGYGIWSGVGLVVAGILGIVVMVKRQKGVLIGFLVVTIIMIIVAASQAITSGVLYGVFKVFADPGKCYKSYGKCTCNHNFNVQSYDESFCDKWEGLVNSLLAITIFNIIGAIVSFVGSIFGCMGTCCATPQGQPGAVVVQQPVIVTTTTHHGYVAQQPGYVAQQPGYVAQQPTHQPGYAPQPAAAYPPQVAGAPPQYTEKH